MPSLIKTLTGVVDVVSVSSSVYVTVMAPNELTLGQKLLYVISASGSHNSNRYYSTIGFEFSIPTTGNNLYVDSHSGYSKRETNGFGARNFGGPPENEGVHFARAVIVEVRQSYIDVAVEARLSFSREPASTNDEMYYSYTVSVFDISDLVKGVDYWEYMDVPSGNSTSPQTMLNYTMQAPVAGKYLVLVNAGGGVSTATNKDNFRIYATINGTTVGLVTYEYEDVGQYDSPLFMRVVDVAAGANISVTTTLDSTKGSALKYVIGTSYDYGGNATYPDRKYTFNSLIIFRDMTLFEICAEAFDSNTVSSGTETVTTPNYTPLSISDKFFVFGHMSQRGDGGDNMAGSVRLSLDSGQSYMDSDFRGSEATGTPDFIHAFYLGEFEPATTSYPVAGQVRATTTLSTHSYYGYVALLRLLDGSGVVVHEAQADIQGSATLTSKLVAASTVQSEADILTGSSLAALAITTPDVYLRTGADVLTDSTLVADCELIQTIKRPYAPITASAALTLEPQKISRDIYQPIARTYPSVQHSQNTTYSKLYAQGDEVILGEIPLDGYKPNTTYVLIVDSNLIHYWYNTSNFIDSTIEYIITLGDPSEPYNGTHDQILHSGQNPNSRQGSVYGSAYNTQMGYPPVPETGTFAYYKDGNTLPIIFTTGSTVVGKSIKIRTALTFLDLKGGTMSHCSPTGMCDFRTLEIGNGVEGVDFGIAELSTPPAAVWNVLKNRWVRDIEYDLVAEGLYVEGEVRYIHPIVSVGSLKTTSTATTAKDVYASVECYSQRIVDGAIDNSRYGYHISMEANSRMYLTDGTDTHNIWAGLVSVGIFMAVGTDDHTNDPVKLFVNCGLRDEGASPFQDMIDLYNNMPIAVKVLWFKNTVWKKMSGITPVGVYHTVTPPYPPYPISKTVDVFTWSKTYTNKSGYVYSHTGTKEYQDRMISLLQGMLDHTVAVAGSTLEYGIRNNETIEVRSPSVTIVFESSISPTSASISSSASLTASPVAYKTVKQIEAEISTSSSLTTQEGWGFWRDTLLADISAQSQMTAQGLVLRRTRANIATTSLAVAEPLLISEILFSSKTPMGWLNSLLADIQAADPLPQLAIRWLRPFMYNLTGTPASTKTVVLYRSYYNKLPTLVRQTYYELQAVDNLIRANRNYAVLIEGNTKTLITKRHYQILVEQADTSQINMARTYAVHRPAFEDEILALVNEERVRVGVRPLLKYSGHGLVENIAHSHAVNMHVYDAYGHDSGNYRDGYKIFEGRLKRLAPWYSSDAGAENCANINVTDTIDLNGLVTAREFYEGWRQSPSHYANMIADWEEILGVEDVDVEMMLGLESTTSAHVNDVYHGEYFNFEPQPQVMNYAVQNFVISPRSVAVITQSAYSRHYQLQAPVTAFVDRHYQILTYNHVKNTIAVSYGQITSNVVVGKYSTEIGRSLEVPITWEVRNSLLAQYSDTVEAKNRLDANYNLEAGVQVAATIVGNYGQEVAKAFDAQYSTTPEAANTITAEYGATPEASASLEVNYSEMPVAGAELVVSYGSTPEAKNQLEVAYGEYREAQNALTAAYGATAVPSAVLDAKYSTTDPVANTVEANYSLQDTNPAANVTIGRYHLLSESAIITTGTPTATVNGKQYKVDSVEIALTEEGVYWKGQIVIKDIEMFNALRKGSKFTLDFYGTVYNLVVDSRKTDRPEVAKLRRVVDVSTIASLKGRADTPTVTLLNSSSQLAHDLAEQVLGAPIAWNILDWPIPAFRYSVEGVTPIDAARVIIESVGGLLKSNPDGSFKAIYKHKVSYDEYDTTTPDVSVTDVEDVIAQSENYDFADVKNKFRISETLSIFSDKVEYVPAEDSEGISQHYGKLKAYPSPWRTNVRIRTTSGANVLLGFSGIIDREEEEVLEFIRGEASTVYPVESLVNIEWLSEPLGGMTFDKFAVNITTPTTVNEGYGLAKVTYNTRAIEYDTTLPIDVEVQFILEDLG